MHFIPNRPIPIQWSSISQTERGISIASGRNSEDHFFSEQSFYSGTVSTTLRPFRKTSAPAHDPAEFQHRFREKRDLAVVIRNSMHTKFVSGLEVSSFSCGSKLTESQLALLQVFLKRNNTLFNSEKLGLIYDADRQTAELAPEKEIAQRKRQLEKKK